MTRRTVTWTDDTGTHITDATDLEDAAFLADYFGDAYGATDITVTDPNDLA